MVFESLPLAGLTLIAPTQFQDLRGVFVKTFHELLWAKAGIKFHAAEEFYSTSHRGVIRGMHFQSPPFSHEKVVTCIQGAVLDVVLDLRKGSRTYGKATGVELSAANHHVLYIPRGFAHGFLALQECSIIYYKVSSVHEPAADNGIRWDSFTFDWGISSPTISPRDSKFPRLHDFDSPFA